MGGLSGELGTMGRLPPEFAAIMRPELSSLLLEIYTEIRRTIPEYGPVLAGPYGRSIQLAVEQNLVTFVDKLTSPTAPSAERRDKMCRRLGRYEAYEGRSLDCLQAAIRLGARLGLRRAQKVGRRYNLSPAVLLTFADALFGYVEELVSVAREGYLEAKAELEGGQDILRRRLLQLILAGGTVAHASLAELSDQTGWPLPDEVTLVAVSPDARPERGTLSGDVLADIDGAEPHFLIPGPVDADRRTVLEAAPDGIRLAVGPTVARGEAAQSLRWARQTLGLVESGVLEERPVTFSENHLITLWLQSDAALLDQLAKRQLAPLSDLTSNQRERLVETLEAWLATRGNAVRMAELLHLHPQTVRYRLRGLDRAFGDLLNDWDHRFATEVVLRALHLRERSALPPRSAAADGGASPRTETRTETRTEPRAGHHTGPPQPPPSLTGHAEDVTR
ncbi:PucR family transcriptional regulator [Streptomyces sp. NPDC054796]